VIGTAGPRATMPRPIGPADEEATMHIKRGFTLIELLVVIAILALLISILVPSLRAAREGARTTVCLTVLRGAGSAFVLYQGDHDGLMPAMKIHAPHSGPMSRWEDAGVALGQALPCWADLLVDAEYLAVEDLDCPSLEGRGLGTGTAGTSYLEPTNRALEYGVNVFLTAGHGVIPTDASKPWNLDRVSRPGEGILLGDSNAPSWTPWHIAPWMQGVFEHLAGIGSNVDGRQRHNANRTINLLMFDGHAASRNPFDKITFDSPPFADWFGFTAYSIYRDGSSVPPANPTPLWRPWKPFF